MPCAALLPPELVQAMDSILVRHKFKLLAVYAEAENLRRQWLGHNIALEDIVNELVKRSEIYQVAIAFEPEEAAAALLGTNEASGHENPVLKLLPIDHEGFRLALHSRLH